MTLRGFDFFKNHFLRREITEFMLQRRKGSGGGGIQIGGGKSEQFTVSLTILLRRTEQQRDILRFSQFIARSLASPLGFVYFMGNVRCVSYDGSRWSAAWHHAWLVHSS